METQLFPSWKYISVQKDRKNDQDGQADDRLPPMFREMPVQIMGKAKKCTVRLISFSEQTARRSWSGAALCGDGSVVLTRTTNRENCAGGRKQILLPPRPSTPQRSGVLPAG